MQVRLNLLSHTFFPLIQEKQVFNKCGKNVPEILVNCLQGLNQEQLSVTKQKSSVLTSVVYHGSKVTRQNKDLFITVSLLHKKLFYIAMLIWRVEA